LKTILIKPTRAFLFCPKSGNVDFQVKVDLGNIISLDAEKRIVRVEPMVSIGQLNDYLVSSTWKFSIERLERLGRKTELANRNKLS